MRSTHPSPSGSGSSRRSVLSGRPVVAAPVLPVAVVSSWAGSASSFATSSSASASSAPAALGRTGPGGGLAEAEVDVEDALLTVHSLRVQMGLLKTICIDVLAFVRACRPLCRRVMTINSRGRSNSKKYCLEAMNRISDACRVRDYTKIFDLAQGIGVCQPMWNQPPAQPRADVLLSFKSCLPRHRHRRARSPSPSCRPFPSSTWGPCRNPRRPSAC